MRILLYILIALISFCNSAFSLTDELNKKIQKKVSADIIGIPLEKTLQQISQLTGLEIIPLNSLTADNKLATTKVFLQVQDMPVKQLLEWLARTVNTHYRIFDDGRVYLSDCYEWIAANQFGMLFLDISSLTANNSELTNFDNILAETTRIISLFDANFYARIEEQGNITKLVAHTPKELKPLFHNLVLECSKKGKSIFYKNIFTHSELQNFIEKTKIIKQITYPYLSLPEIIRKLENDFGINIGFCSTMFNKSDQLPKLSLKLGEVSFKEAIESLLHKTEFSGVEIFLPNGIWLTRGNENWSEASSREFLWVDNITIISYNIPQLDLKIGGEKIAEEIKLAITPKTWFDPLASVIYHKKSNNLIVIADMKTQNRVLLALQELSKRLGTEK